MAYNNPAAGRKVNITAIIGKRVSAQELQAKGAAQH
jgi:hypothetical protein